MLHARRTGRAKRPAGRRREDCRALLRKVSGATIAVAKEAIAETGGDAHAKHWLSAPSPCACTLNCVHNG